MKGDPTLPGKPGPVAEAGWRSIVTSDTLGAVACLGFILFQVVAAHSQNLSTVIPFFASLVTCLGFALAAVIRGHIERARPQDLTQGAIKPSKFGLIAGYPCIVLLLVTLPLTLFELSYVGCGSQGFGACS